MLVFPDYNLIINELQILKNYSKNIFEFLHPYLTESLYSCIMERKIGNRGPKPQKSNIERFLNALFHQLDEAPKIASLEKYHGITRGTYYRYLRILHDNQLIQCFHQELLKNSDMPSLLSVDSTHLRSLDGSEGVQYGYKEHGKKALKLTVLTGTNKVIYHKTLHPDNYNDTVCFEDLVTNNPSKKVKTVLADRGYIGERFKKVCRSKGYEVVTPPKKGCSSGPSNYEQLLLKMYRSRVEHVFSQLKRFRGIQLKYNKTLWVYSLLIDLGALIISIHNGIIRKGLIYSH